MAGDARFYKAANATGGTDADDRVVYDTVSGSLYYDPDGNGTQAAQQLFGVLDNRTSFFAATNFSVFFNPGGPGGD